MNPVERLLKAGANLIGEPKYRVKVLPKGSWKKEVMVIGVLDNKDNYVGERKYHSLFDAGVSAGSERIWARLEWAMGEVIGLAGLTAITESDLFDPSSVNGPLLLLGIGLVFLGGIMMTHGRERSGITSSIIRELRKN